MDVWGVVLMQNVVSLILVTCVEGQREMERKSGERVRRNTEMCLRDLLKLLHVVKKTDKLSTRSISLLGQRSSLCK